jgi:hypothetical protein
MPQHSPAARFDWRRFLLSMLILAAVGWAAAGTPFRGDQALFAADAERMHAGAVLYHDLWEVTNPGVFWFYEAAGTGFGFREDGVHLFEWLYWVLFVQVVSFAVKRAHQLPRWPLAPAVLVGGVYYLTSCSDPSHLTKAEGLVAFPLFLTAWLACRAVNGPRVSGILLLAAGMAGGAAVLFKLAFAPCVAAAWLPAAVVCVRRREWGRPFALPLGMAVVLAAAVGYFASHGAVEDAFRSLFVTPRQVLAVAEPAGFDRLANSVRWLVETYSPVLAAAVLGTLVTLRRRLDPFVIAVGLVCVAAGPVVLVQRWSWWSYHFLLIAVPVSVLAAYTWPVVLIAVTERLARPLTRREKWVGAAAGVMLFLPALGHGANAYRRLFHHHLGITPDDRAAARTEAGRAYADALAETGWLHGPGARPGPIFVAGDPLFHTLSGRPMCTAIHGWSLELLTPQLWDQLLAELKATRPVYVYVHAHMYHYDQLIDARCPEFRAWLTAEYREVRRSPAGSWFERRAGAGE